ncbi:MAG: twin-arginine translocase subunit TatC [Rhodospirillales bacterium]|nr:twin-arginine translocase subunit TatC [Rhodospirillales bacterium]
MASRTDRDESEIEASRAPLIDHLIELRDRLKWAVVAFFVCFVIAYVFAEDIYAFLVRPLAKIYEQRGVENPRMIYTALTEAFFTYLKVSFYAALFVSFPVIATQLYKFAAPGLYRTERRAFLPFLVATPVLFALGATLVYSFIFPLAWSFFLSFQTASVDTGLAIELEAKVNEYLSLVLKLMFAFGLAFQLPVAITLLARAGLTTADALRRRRKYAVVIAFVGAALLTPPDLISQVGLGIPIIVLFEISILLAAAMERRHGHGEDEDLAEDEGDDPDDDPDGGGPDDDIPETDYHMGR